MSSSVSMAGAASRATTGGASKRRNRRNTTAQRGNGASSGVAATAAAAGRKNLGWLGARRRQSRWAAEIRMPRTRDKLWIGTFSAPEQAALAYDAAIFCLYGAQLPASRKLNFPTAPRPNIPEHVRLGLTVSNIKAIAEKYARTLAVYLVPAPPPPVLLPAPAPAPAPLMVEAAAVEAAAAAAAGAGAASAITANHCDMNAMDVAGVNTVEEDSLFSFNPEELDHWMADIFDNAADRSS